jgi:hypothetical protein
MAYGPPPEPNEQAQQHGTPHPQQGRAGSGGPAGHGGPPAAERPPGAGLAVASVVLGLLACALPLLPVAMDGVRQYVSFPFGLGGLVLAIGAFTGDRRGKPVALAGAVLCGLAVGLGLFMVGGTAG